MARDKREHSFFIKAQKHDFDPRFILRQIVKSLVSQASLFVSAWSLLEIIFFRIYFVKWLVLYFRSCKHKKCNKLVRFFIITLFKRHFARCLHRHDIHRQQENDNVLQKASRANGTWQTILESFLTDMILIFSSNRVVTWYEKGKSGFLNCSVVLMEPTRTAQ